MNISFVLPGMPVIDSAGVRGLHGHIHGRAHEVASRKYQVNLREGTLEGTLSSLVSNEVVGFFDPRINSGNFPYPYQKEEEEVTLGFSIRPAYKELKRTEDLAAWTLKKTGARRLAWPFEVACWALQYPTKFNGVDIWCLDPPRLLEKDGYVFWYVVRFDSCYSNKPGVCLWSFARAFEEPIKRDSSAHDMIPVVF